MIIRHFGMEVVRKESKIENEEILMDIYNKLYRELIEAIDGFDNGIEQYPEDIPPAYRLTTHLTFQKTHIYLILSC
jgi:uncharacterized UPF0160 family protein